MGSRVPGSSCAPPLSPALKGSLFYLAFYSATAVYLSFMNVYCHSLGLSEWEIGLLSALLPAASFPNTPVLADRQHRRVQVLAGCMLHLAGRLAPLH